MLYGLMQRCRVANNTTAAPPLRSEPWVDQFGIPTVQAAEYWGLIAVELESSETDLTALEARVTALEAAIVIIEAQITAIEADIVTINAAIVIIEAAIVAIEADIVAIQADITTIQANIVTIQNDITAIEARLDAIEALQFIEVTATANHTTTRNEVITCTNTSAITITLEASPDALQDVHVTRTNASVTIDGNGNNINGSSTVKLISKGDSVHLIYNDSLSEWAIR